MCGALDHYVQSRNAVWYCPHTCTETHEPELRFHAFLLERCAPCFVLPRAHPRHAFDYGALHLCHYISGSILDLVNRRFATPEDLTS